MPKRTDIESVLVIGAGPIVIGQAGEFDYSGTQACKALRAEGYRTVLVNSNPATIMTDPATADATYVEPVTPAAVARIIERERPDAVLPTMGGQTALNCALTLQRDGVLERCGVEMIGADAAAIDKAEDRELFRAAMQRIGLATPRSHLAHGMPEALAALDDIGLPCVVRPSFTMGGTGGGIAYNRAEFLAVIERGLDASPTTEVLIEESVLGWKEYEMEVVRDRNDNCIIVCSIENLDPMGVHTGDSITVAPALTLTDKEYQTMRDAALAVLREIGVETGGANVQFAVNPADGRLVVIEMNPRVSRSSALASKATGFPIAKVAAQLAVGYALDEIGNDITGGATPAAFEPAIDYVVVKIPRFAFEKFPGAADTLTTAMQSVGEAMAVGRTFAESLQKALRGLETGLAGLDEVEIAGLGQGDDRAAVQAALGRPAPDRILKIAQALRLGFDADMVHGCCRVDPWFLRQIAAVVDLEAQVRDRGLPADAGNLRMLKSWGFSDARLAALAGCSEADVAELRAELAVHPQFKRIDTCAAEFESPTAYMYSTYEAPFAGTAACEAEPTGARKVIILGGGPNRIGQGIEFDYCCCHAAYALKEAGYETIMVNCNPETVSTDYDTADRLYFEPLAAEDVLAVVRAEQRRGALQGVAVQFGGQTPLKLARALEQAGAPILGTAPDSIDLAEDRDRFQQVLRELGLRQPANGIAHSAEQGRRTAAALDYPLVVRPSYVLGGRAMQVLRNESDLEAYFAETLPGLAPAGTVNQLLAANPLLFDRFLTDAVEVDADALCDGTAARTVAVMEHIEEAGIHSGDSACALPPHSLPAEIQAEIRRQTELLAVKLGVRGLLNAQFAVKDGEVYVLEANPRASRTVPFVAKAVGFPVAQAAALLMAGRPLADFDLPDPAALGHTAVKQPVFPFGRFAGVDVLLGPEMKSTGETMGLARRFAVAFAKAQLKTVDAAVPESGTVFVSVRDADKPAIMDSVRLLADLGFEIAATGGTARFLADQGIECRKINKVLEGRPHIVDALKNREVQLVVNTTEGEQAVADSRSLRRAALEARTPYYTTAAGANAAAQGIAAHRAAPFGVRPLQDYFGEDSA